MLKHILFNVIVVPITIIVFIYISGLLISFNSYLSLKNDRDLWEIRRHIYCVYPAIMTIDEYYVASGKYPDNIRKFKNTYPSYYFKFMADYAYFLPLSYNSRGDQYEVWIKPGWNDISYASESKTWRIHDFYYEPHLFTNLYDQ